MEGLPSALEVGDDPPARGAKQEGGGNASASRPAPPAGSSAGGGEERGGGAAGEVGGKSHADAHVSNTSGRAEPSGGGNHSRAGKHGGGKKKPGRPHSYYASLEFLVRVLAVLVVVELLAAVLFEWSHQRWVNVDFGRPLPAMPTQRRTELGRMFVGFPQLMRPYFCSLAGMKGRIFAGTIVALGLLGLFFNFVHNTWQKEWWDLFNKADAKRFPELMGVYALLVTGWMLNNVYLDYVRAWLYIDWREFMTWYFLQQWLASHSHFLIQLNGGRGSHKRVDNPEQRLQEDIHLFIENALSIVPEFLASVGNLLVFIPVVLYLEPSKAFGVVHLPGWLLYLAVVYSLMGGLTTHCIGWKMVSFSFARQRYEADFRHMALHVRDQAESVALYSSEATEEANLRQQFERIKLVKWRQMIVAKRLSFFTNTYGFVQFLVPFFILAPSYFKKDLSLGDLFQLTGALGNVANSFDWFLRVYGDLADWRATADRLLSFEAAIASVQAQAAHCASSLKHDRGGPRPAAAALGGAADLGAEASASPASGTKRRSLNSDGISGFDGGESESWLQAQIAEVRLPDGEPLWKDIDLQLRRGQTALISGPEGVGKSVLFKALAGVWPHVQGSSVRLPADDPGEVLFVPQRPALPKRCSLGDALAYPELRSAYSDEAMMRALRDVRLDQLVLEATTDSDGSGSAGVDERPRGAERPAARARPHSGGAAAGARRAGGGEEAPCPEPAPEPTEPAPEPAAPVDEVDLPSDTDSPFLLDPDSLGLDRVEDWGKRLSPGQQQRLAIGHVLLRRPSVVFLDEATASVGKDSAAELYRVVLQQLPADAVVVSISHDVDVLEPLHDVHLTTCDGDGSAKKLCVVKSAGR